MKRIDQNKKNIVGAHATTSCCEPTMEHRKGDRRKCDCKGYTYITMVGWMCRREQARRGRDKV